VDTDYYDNGKVKATTNEALKARMKISFDPPWRDGYVEKGLMPRLGLECRP
jgi:hypothetical protein